MKFRYNNTEVTLLFIFEVLLVAFCIAVYYPLGQKQPQQTLPGFLGARDSHDIQWEAFRRNFPITLLIALVSTRVLPRDSVFWQTAVGMGIAGFCFRSDILLYLAILSAYYCYCKALYKNKRFEFIIWVTAVANLLLLEYWDRLRGTSKSIDDSMPLQFLKSANGPMHWAALFNMSILRIISFGVDNHRSHYNKQSISQHLKKCKECQPEAPCLDARDKTSCKQQMSLANFLNYMFFAPVFLAGPPISYNNFQSFKTTPTNPNSPSPIIRFVLVFISFEIYQVILPNCKVLDTNSLLELQIVSIVALLFIWYKFLVIWRWAKVWSYLYGVEVIDNMNRCVLNNYGFQGFWRMWHRGFNKWLIRYLYIPLGGNKNMLLSFVGVFGFVALWHDTELKLLLWALAIVPVILPEILVKRYFRSRHPALFSKLWFKYLSALGGACEVYLMCIANIIGFGFGAQGLMTVLSKFTDVFTLLMSLLAITLTVVLMFYQRDVIQANKVKF